MEPVLGKITISRTHSTIKGDYITLSVVDENAVIEPIDIKMTIEDFGRAITGEGRLPCSFVLRGVDKVGKVREAKPLEFQLPDGETGKEAARAIAKRECPEGWTPWLSFNSQFSFFTKEGENWARTTIYRWVDLE
jgi:hypothetical protein